MKIGYCRVSTQEQDNTRQILKMQELGIEERFVFVDVYSDQIRPPSRAKRATLTVSEGHYHGRQGHPLYTALVNQITMFDSAS
ncbi:hypothetical protein JCM14036_10310 [Desulfotomaculum defluvii]